MTTNRLYLLVSSIFLAASVNSSPTMCHCGNGQYGLQCPQPIQFNCPPPPACPTPPPCNMFGNLPTLPTLPPSAFGTLAPITLAPLNPPSAPAQPVPSPSNGQETLVGINQPPTYPTAPFNPAGGGGGGPVVQQYNNQPPTGYGQAPTRQEVPQQAQEPPRVYQESPQQQQQAYTQLPVIESTTIRPSTLPNERYVELENPENGEQRGPPVLQNVVDHVYESEPNNGYRQPVRREAVNSKCNDDRLKRIIEQNVDDNPSTSKRKIQKAAGEQIGGLFDVICSAHDFSYLANTQLFCEAGNDDITCFAFLHSLIQ